MARNLSRSLVLIASLIGGCGLATGSSAWGRQDAAATEVEKERAALPHSVVVDVITQALGDKAPEAVQLKPAQLSELKASNEKFKAEVLRFLKGGMNQPGEVMVPDRNAMIKKTLAGLGKDQAALVDKALNNTATKRYHEKHSSTTTSPDGTRQTSTSSETSSESQSSHSSQSNHSSQHNSQSKSDKHSDNKSDKRSDNKSDKHSESKSDSSKQSDSQKVNWSKLDAKQREGVVRGLLEEFPAKERAELAKELKLEPVPAKSK